MAQIFGSITAKIPLETFEKKKKALYVLNAEGSNLSKKITELIEEYAAKFDETSAKEQ